ncbi:hypothetical protein G3I43_14575, partial [Streptomyces anulatus]|nr:hypothetical protein [Streptomyces anulatus]
MESDDQYGTAGREDDATGFDGAGFGGPVPPAPSRAPDVGPPPPGAPLRAVGAALLNLTGLGLGYALLGR